MDELMPEQQEEELILMLPQQPQEEGGGQLNGHVANEQSQHQQANDQVAPVQPQQQQQPQEEQEEHQERAGGPQPAAGQGHMREMRKKVWWTFSLFFNKIEIFLFYNF